MHFIRNQPGKGHGFRTVLAKAADCRVTYVSQVLTGQAHFSLEQAESLNAVLGHTEEEADYFIMLIQFDRAGTPLLKSRIKKQMDRILEKRQTLKNRVDIKATLSVEAQARYYGNWYYSVVHMLVAIPSFRTREKISEYLRLPIDTVAEVLEFLIQEGLVRLESGQYVPGLSRVYLGSDSYNITKHHSNWRIQAIQSLDRNIKTDLHFSGVVTMAKGDVTLTKEELIKGIEAARAVVRNSPKEDEAYGICVDFFKI